MKLIKLKGRGKKGAARRRAESQWGMLEGLVLLAETFVWYDRTRVVTSTGRRHGRRRKLAGLVRLFTAFYFAQFGAHIETTPDGRSDAARIHPRSPITVKLSRLSLSPAYPRVIRGENIREFPSRCAISVIKPRNLNGRYDRTAKRVIRRSPRRV